MSRGRSLFVELSDAERAMVEGKAAAEGLSMRELVTRAVTAYKAAPTVDIVKLDGRVSALEVLVSGLVNR